MNTSDNNREILYDKRFKIMSYDQYLIDSKVKKFTKICMTEVVNADMMIATFGEKRYDKTSSEILLMGNAAYKQMGLDSLIHVYIHSYKTFMAVATDDMSDADFYNLMKTNHEHYELIQSQQTGLAGISRFAVAYGDNLIDQVLSAFYLNKSLQNNFIVASDEREQLSNNAEKNVKLLELINYAVKNEKVVPFYQGILNNATGQIDKYEALIRIYDEEGNICPPGMFLNAAKELKLYLPLSRIMIDKSLKDFETKESKLGINLSLLDIQSEEFREWILLRLSQHKKPENVTIEFVETENYDTHSDLFEFLEKVKQMGCKIAVDDFGVGFATYSAIVALKPDIIKIDGDIIKTLATNDNNKLILDSILYMAKLIGSETVAEFVENQQIQDIITEYEVNYSQGYLYAKPEPFEKLDVK